MSQGWRRSPLPDDWADRRKQVLDRDPICRLRILCDGAPSTEVDHLAAHDVHMVEALQGACSPCHKHKSTRQAAAARARKYDRRRKQAPHPGLLPEETR